eukprot:8017115-Alexandrium_andersonii.AAC.1
MQTLKEWTCSYQACCLTCRGRAHKALTGCGLQEVSQLASAAPPEPDASGHDASADLARFN